VKYLERKLQSWKKLVRPWLWKTGLSVSKQKNSWLFKQKKNRLALGII